MRMYAITVNSYMWYIVDEINARLRKVIMTMSWFDVNVNI